MNFGFLDIEMTCDGNQKNGKFIDDGRMKHSHREIISVGFIVCDDKYNIKNRYTSFVKPVHNATITDYCNKLTGINQSDVDNGKKCNNAFRDIMEVCKKYSVKYIFTFGNEDKMGILFSVKWNRKAKERVNNLYAVANKIFDIRPAILNGMDGKIKSKNLGLSNIAEILKVETNGEHHNALNDALLLCKICRELNIQMDKENNIKIRSMNLSDYEPVYKLWLSCAGMGLNNLDDSKEGIERFLKRNPDTCFVAEIGEKIVGVIIVGNDGRRGYIYHTAVNPQYRKQGIARRLVDSAMQELKQCGINKVALVVFDRNENGNAFWEKLGFTVREDLIYRNKSITEMIRIDT